MTPTKRLIVVGSGGFAQVAESFLAGAARINGVEASLIDVRSTQSRWYLVNALHWRLFDHTPPFTRRLQAQLVGAVARGNAPMIITTGLSPVFAETLLECAKRGARCLHYSTDDPWNAGQSARWLNKALPLYDLVLTPRTSNIGDFERLGCKAVRHLPFGYDDRVVNGVPGPSQNTDVLFVGGADDDRRSFIREFVAAGSDVSLVGGYWDRDHETRSRWLGHLSPRDVAALTLNSKINLVLVRRANRDGHVMRSLEAGALGGCLLVEDTPEHRSIFGEDGVTVRYFGDPAQASRIAAGLLQDETERRRLAVAVRDRIRAGRHSYKDRVEQMMELAGNAAAVLPKSYK